MASNSPRDSAPSRLAFRTPTVPSPDAAPTWRRRRLLANGLGLALLGIGCAPVAFADGRLVQVDVIDRDAGTPLHVYRDQGRPVVAGRPGARYAVQVVNRSGERVMVVVAIDGVNIMTGETAAVGQDGYVLAPYQRAQLTGWRKSHSEVAAFEFTGLPDSYAARTGRPDDVGVIGVAVFREKRAWRPWHAPQRDAPDDRTDGGAGVDAPEGRTRSAPPGTAPDVDATPRPAPSARARAAPSREAAATAAPPAMADAGSSRLDAARNAVPAPTARLGTGHGEREPSFVVDTTFDRLTPRPQELVRIRYDSLPNLVAAGIAPAPVAPSRRPRAFPGDPEPGFVPDPPVR